MKSREQEIKKFEAKSKKAQDKNSHQLANGVGRIVDSHQVHREGLTSLRRHSSPLQGLVDELDSVAKLSINALDKLLRREDLGNNCVLIDLFFGY